ncbi:hypothetical protein FRC04_001902 [Tulasnella sp. 424]|nr:hypothetical protein FRC04_001902 [Tulasnella sp. 424]KAG8977680.1 hypothetical protein FRC05_000936 [Tulasnella sp. 425]
MAMPTVNLPYPQGSQQLQTPYEACLYGSVTGSDEFRSVFDRLTLRTENGSSHLHVRELIFQAQLPSSSTNFGYSTPSTGDGNAPMLVCREDLLDEKKSWIISTRGRPEPVRLHPIAIVRPAMHARANGDIYGFASTLGFAFQSETYKRGFTFGKGVVTINVYQLDVHVTETDKWEKAPEEATWYIEAKTPPTTVGIPQSVDALVEIRDLLKGLVDLNRENLVSHT